MPYGRTRTAFLSTSRNPSVQQAQAAKRLELRPRHCLRVTTETNMEIRFGACFGEIKVKSPDTVVPEAKPEEIPRICEEAPDEEPE